MVDAVATAPLDTLRPDGGRPEGTTGPRTPVQAALAGLWAFALGRASVGVDEDFAGLGGDGRSAEYLLTSVARTLGATLPVSGLAGELRTVERMAAAIERDSR